MKKIDFTYSAATVQRRFSLIREVELSKTWYQVLLDKEFSLMVMAEKLAMPNDRHKVIASLDLVTNRYWEAEGAHGDGVIREMIEQATPLRNLIRNEVTIIEKS